VNEIEKKYKERCRECPGCLKKMTPVIKKDAEGNEIIVCKCTNVTCDNYGYEDQLLKDEE